MRVLGERSLARPSKMGAGYDAWVLGLHATHVRVCTRALVCRGQGKGWVRNGAAHVIRTGKKCSSSAYLSCVSSEQVDVHGARPFFL